MASDTAGKAGTRTLYVVAFPELGEPDAALLAKLRAEHHALEAAMIGPHLTFMFDLRDVGADEIAGHVAGVAAASAPIDFVLRRTVLHVEPGAAFAFLAPHEGREAMLDLHRRLHAGPGGRWLDPARRFSPHLTIGKSMSAAEMRALVARLADEETAIAGRIAGLDVVETDGHRMWRRAAFVLGNARGDR